MQVPDIGFLIQGHGDGVLVVAEETLEDCVEFLLLRKSLDLCIQWTEGVLGVGIEREDVPASALRVSLRPSCVCPAEGVSILSPRPLLFSGNFSYSKRNTFWPSACRATYHISSLTCAVPLEFPL